MSAQVYYDDDADLSLLNNKTIAILGYGNQGRAQALNLKDSGCNVIVGQREGSKNYDLAVAEGFKTMSLAEATGQAEMINILLPDESQAEIYLEQIHPHLSQGNLLLCSHGYNIHYKLIVPTEGIDYAMVAPKGVGHQVRSEFERGGGVATLMAIGEGSSPQTRDLCLAYAKGIGGTKGGVFETTFGDETEADLFAEQVVLCGGVSELVKGAFETLVEAGYQPETAYFECLHELKLVVDLLYQGGFSYMHESISNTAEFGEYTRGPRIVNDETRAEMKRILDDIQTGRFAREWSQEYRSGLESLLSRRAEEKEHPIEKVGRKLRRMMSFIDAKEV